MTAGAQNPSPPPATEKRPRAWRFWLLPVLATILVLIVGLRGCAAFVGILGSRNRTAITHDVVVDRIRSVAKLVSTEATVRDVLTYENTWYGSTKRSLVVITARMLAGIDMERGTNVRVDEGARRIAITLPHATVMAIEITDMRTYDEQRGLWNPFTPADRDRIFQLGRQQLARSADEMNLAQRAEQSAADLLRTMFTVDGWTAEVTFRDQPAVSQPAER